MCRRLLFWGHHAIGHLFVIPNTSEAIQECFLFQGCSFPPEEGNEHPVTGNGDFAGVAADVPIYHQTGVESFYALF
jgi:hypothetical protein